MHMTGVPPEAVGGFPAVYAVGSGVQRPDKSRGVVFLLRNAKGGNGGRRPQMCMHIQQSRENKILLPQLQANICRLVGQFVCQEGIGSKAVFCPAPSAVDLDLAHVVTLLYVVLYHR